MLARSVFRKLSRALVPLHNLPPEVGGSLSLLVDSTNTPEALLARTLVSRYFRLAATVGAGASLRELFKESYLSSSQPWSGADRLDVGMASLRVLNEHGAELGPLSNLTRMQGEWINLTDDAQGLLCIEKGAILIESSKCKSAEEAGALTERVHTGLEAIAQDVIVALASRDHADDEKDVFAARLDILLQTFFHKHGFAGNRVDYYAGSNNFIEEVLSTKTGNPITLSVVFMAVARLCGINVVGLNNPGHFLVRALHPLDSKQDVVLDVFNGGVVVKDLPANISVATPAELWSRMLGNLMSMEMSALPPPTEGVDNLLDFQGFDPSRAAKAALWSVQLVFLRNFSNKETGANSDIDDSRMEPT